jgi:hypothetical protein
MTAWLRKLPTPVLSGSGSRVFLSPTSWSTPVSIHLIETLAASIGKWDEARNLSNASAFLSTPQRFNQRPIALQRGNGKPFYLCGVVGTAQGNRLTRIRESQKRRRLGCRHGAALQAEALY